MPVDLGADYLSGLRTAASITTERQRLAQERENAQMEAEARAATEQRIALESQARLQTEKAYRDAELAIRARRLQQVDTANALRTRQAAAKFAAQQKLTALVKQGVPLDRALYEVPELSTPTLVNEIQRQRQQHTDAARRMDLTQSGQQLARERLDNRKGLETVKVNIPASEAVEPVLASSGFLGFGAHPATPGKAAVPQQTITFSRPVGSSAMPPLPSDSTPPAPTPEKSQKEVTRKTKAGRMAVFNADTKEFIRYAD